MKKKFMIHSVSCGLSHVVRWFGIALVMGMLIACGEDPQQLFETAQFEEEQHNQAHARELYERIVHDHPASSVARKAEERLKELTKEKGEGL